MFNTIAEVKKANKAKGQHFFSKDTLAFFGSNVYNGLYTVAGRQFFITSEDNYNRTERGYTIREAMPDGDIETIGEFLQYATKEQAIFAIPFQIVGVSNGKQ
jgi:hypothetical protein